MNIKSTRSQSVQNVGVSIRSVKHDAPVGRYPKNKALSKDRSARFMDREKYVTGKHIYKLITENT